MQTLCLTSSPEGISVYADFWSRGMAKLFDLMIISACLLPVDLILRTSFVLHRVPPAANTEGQDVAVFVLLCLYSAVMESSKWQATLGKRAVGILVADSAGNRISFHNALFRSIAQITQFGYLLTLFTIRKQGLHDLVANTRVVPGTL